jgi:hypothetical protein
LIDTRPSIEGQEEDDIVGIEGSLPSHTLVPLTRKEHSELIKKEQKEQKNAHTIKTTQNENNLQEKPITIENNKNIYPEKKQKQQAVVKTTQKKRDIQKREPAETFVTSTPYSVPRRGGITAFSIPAQAEKGYPIPPLSFTPAFIEEGAKVGTELRNVAALLEYTTLGPNGSRLSLKNCKIELELKANYKHADVQAEPKFISCMSPNGKTFQKKVTGRIIGKNKEIVGIDAQVVLEGPLKASAISGTKNLLKTYGEALKTVNQTVAAISSERNTDQYTNVTGNKKEYVSGEIIRESAEFLSKIRDYFEMQEAFFFVKSGTRVFVRNTNEIYIPIHFFEESQ